MDDGSLKAAKILTSITEEVLENTETSSTEYSAISAKDVESTKIVMNIVSSDITRCKNAAKKILQSCSATTSTEVQNLLESSCSEYEAALIKQGAEFKNEVFDRVDDLLEVLKQRVPASAASAATSDGADDADDASDASAS